MNAITSFAKAAPRAVDEFLNCLNDEDRAVVSGLVDAGSALAISLVIQPDGASTVMLEAVDLQGGRRVIAHVCGVFHSVQ